MVRAAPLRSGPARAAPAPRRAFSERRAMPGRALASRPTSPCSRACQRRPARAGSAGIAVRSSSSALMSVVHDRPAADRRRSSAWRAQPSSGQPEQHADLVLGAPWNTGVLASKPSSCAAQPEVRLQDLPDVHAARHAERVQHDVDRRAVREERHVLFGHDAGDDALVAVAARPSCRPPRSCASRRCRPSPAGPRPAGSSSGWKTLSIWSSVFSSTRARSRCGGVDRSARIRSFGGLSPTTRSVFRSTSVRSSSSSTRPGELGAGRQVLLHRARLEHQRRLPGPSSSSLELLDHAPREMRAFSSCSIRRTSPIRSPRSFSRTWSSMRG